MAFLLKRLLGDRKRDEKSIDHFEVRPKIIIYNPSKVTELGDFCIRSTEKERCEYSFTTLQVKLNNIRTLNDFIIDTRYSEGTGSTHFYAIESYSFKLFILFEISGIVDWYHIVCKDNGPHIMILSQQNNEIELSIYRLVSQSGVYRAERILHLDKKQYLDIKRIGDHIITVTKPINDKSKIYFWRFSNVSEKYENEELYIPRNFSIFDSRRIQFLGSNQIIKIEHASDIITLPPEFNQKKARIEIDEDLIAILGEDIQIWRLGNRSRYNTGGIRKVQTLHAPLYTAYSPSKNILIIPLSERKIQIYTLRTGKFEGLTQNVFFLNQEVTLSKKIDFTETTRVSGIYNQYHLQDRDDQLKKMIPFSSNSIDDRYFRMIILNFCFT